MELRFKPEYVDENLPEDFDPSDLSPYRALDKHADYVAERLESPPLVLIDLDNDPVENIREKLQVPHKTQGGRCCASLEDGSED